MAIAVKRATVVVELCTDMELNARHETLSAELVDRRKNGVNDDRLTGDPVAAEIVELEQAMQDHVLLFTLRAMPRKSWAELKAAHPARDENEIDEVYGVNVETFADAALEKSIVSVTQKTTGEAIPWAPTDWQGLADEISNGQWEAFVTRMFTLNNGNVGVPFNYAASKKTLTSGNN
jgi:hypothetical protein